MLFQLWYSKTTTASPVIQLTPHQNKCSTLTCQYEQNYSTHKTDTWKEKSTYFLKNQILLKIQMCETSRQNSKLKWWSTKQSFQESGREWETHPLRKRWLLKRSGQVLESVSYNCVLLCESETVSTTMAHKLRNCTNLILLSVFSQRSGSYMKSNVAIIIKPLQQNVTVQPELGLKKTASWIKWIT